MGELRRVAVRVDQGHGLGESFERLFSLAFCRIRRRQVAEERGPLAPLRLQRQRGRGLPTDRSPLAAFYRGLRREAVEDATLRARQRLVADEVVEASAEPGGNDLQGAEGRTNEARLHLTNKALGQLVAGKLRLAQSQGVSSGADPLAQGHRLLNCFRQTRHRRSPV